VLVLAVLVLGYLPEFLVELAREGVVAGATVRGAAVDVSEVVTDIGFSDVPSLSTLAGTLTRPAPSKGNKTAAAD
jgi:hypothetical protein